MVIFVAVLFVSYLYKLGFLQIATYGFLILIILALLLNLTRSEHGLTSKLFWFLMLAGFIYVLMDKYLKLHIALSRFTAGYSRINSVILVNLAYISAFFIFLAFFYRMLRAEFERNPTWILLLIIATGLKIAAVFSDYVAHDITEDYFEVVSLYFYFSAFLAAYIHSFKKVREAGNNENRTVSSTN